MTVEYLEPDHNECVEIATEIFLEKAGLNREGKKFERMRKQALMHRDLLDQYTDFKVAYLYTDKVNMIHSVAHIEDETFSCPAFNQVDPDSVKGAFVYVISAGTFSCPDEKVMDQLYVDIWGSAMVDAVRVIMKRKFGQYGNISDSFGPGLYGMDLWEMHAIDRLLGFAGLGITLYERGIMVPLKSCAGIIFSVDDSYRKLNDACTHCLGEASSCRLCEFNNRISF